MRTKIIAKSDHSVFIGTEPDGDFCVLSLDDSVDIELGDVLPGTFDDSDGLFKDVCNETQQDTVHICMENWQCSQQVAFGFLQRLNRANIYLTQHEFSCDCSGMQDEMPETLHEAISYFSHGDNALRVMVAKRWPEGVICPHCQSKTAKFMEKRQAWQCRDCRKQFTIKVGTIFEDSPIKLDKWLSALWLITNAKNGISSCEIARALGVTQKTAWFMLHRIRLAMHNGTVEKMTGRVEADETFIGGKARNMHKSVKERRNIKTGGESMTPVMGLLERGARDECSKVRTKVLKGRGSAELQGHIRKYVLKGEEVISGSHRGYAGLHDEYTHSVIDHAVAYVNGHVHTNGLENFWSLLKRAVKGTYVSVEPFHLFRYLDEQSFRFNERKDKDGDKGRFLTALSGIFGKRLTYRNLIGFDTVSNLPAAGAW